LERETNSNEIFKKLALKTNKSLEVNIIEIVDVRSVKIDVSMEDYLNSGIFVYGQEVNNFMNLQKSYIWTVATAALQEVDRQLQSEKLKNIELSNKVDVLINSNSLQDANNQMQSQVDTLTQELTVEKEKNTVLENKVQNIEKQLEELQAKHDDFETKMDLKLKVYVDLINNVLTTK
jgi:hypothetical protein